MTYSNNQIRSRKSASSAPIFESLEPRMLLSSSGFGPDLDAYGVRVSDTTVNPGQVVSVDWTAINRGTGSAGSTQQGVMWSTNSIISKSDRTLAKEYLGYMSAGRTDPESHTITIPSVYVVS